MKEKNRAEILFPSRKQNENQSEKIIGRVMVSKYVLYGTASCSGEHNHPHSRETGRTELMPRHP